VPEDNESRTTEQQGTQQQTVQSTGRTDLATSLRLELKL
jgi:hypothetical protein